MCACLQCHLIFKCNSCHYIWLSIGVPLYYYYRYCNLVKNPKITNLVMLKCNLKSKWAWENQQKKMHFGTHTKFIQISLVNLNLVRFVYVFSVHLFWSNETETGQSIYCEIYDVDLIFFFFFFLIFCFWWRLCSLTNR